ncbi:hypothetical protein CCO03_05065 [Comamonas serinivorans]|uniref:DUF2818 domain-containing protein n=1 Tax=Comamonas serinivorans TaxID=1082851 RepID=A0A1Y0EKL1_9BURK|nr:DUF2818 family protein [Comamonas serinivorans]ARU04127.1 hypothetical protein CCO03_05065 [Comamonas serinivorans]
MNQSQLLWILLLAALVAANLPFVNDRWLAIGPRMRTRKHLGWRLGEWLVWLVAVIALGRGLEQWLGQAAPQGWAFYAVMTCLFATFAFPGFVYRHLLKRK